MAGLLQNGRMQAVVVRAPMDFGVVSVPVPTAPPGGLLLRIKACGLCGSDLRTLRYGHRKVQLPYVIGHEICGVVAEIGPGYSGRWTTGDLLSMGPVVYCGHCDFCLEGRYELCEHYREIAQALYVSPETVKKTMGSVFTKLEVKSRRQLEDIEFG